MYKEVYDGEVLNCITNLEGTIAIPIDPANSDYQRYLRWLEDPNEDQAI